MNNSLKEVKSKYNGIFEYEDHEYYLKKDELLILIKKSNEDWWLCVRHNENEPFFVPSTYLIELDPDVDYDDDEDDDGHGHGRVQNKSDYYAVDEIIDDLNERLNQEVAMNAASGTAAIRKPTIKERRTIAATKTRPPPQQRYSSIDDELVADVRDTRNEYEQVADSPNQHTVIERKISNSSETNEDSDEEEEEDADEDDVEDVDEDPAEDYDQAIAGSVGNVAGGSNASEPSGNDRKLSDISVDNLNIPNGWVSYKDHFGRRVFYNEFDQAKWYLAVNENSKPYFYNSDQQSIWKLPEIQPTQEQLQQQMQHFNNKFDEELSTFNHLCIKNSVIKNKDDAPQITYNKPPVVLENKFKIVKIVENGSKCRKKVSEYFKVTMASSKLLFVKEITKTQKKLEFHLDFKGGKCYRHDAKNKEHQKLGDFIRHPKNTFIVETLNGNKIAFIDENQNLIDEWVNAINLVIKQVQSEFSPVYEEPQLLHSTQLNDSPTKKDSSTERLDTIDQPSATSNQKSKIKKPIDYQVEYHDDPLARKQALLHASASMPYGNRKTLTLEPNVKIVERTVPTPATTTTNVNTPANAYKLKAQLIAFFKRRPTADQLKQRGIIQECVFGSNLISLCTREKRSVPYFVEEIIRVIEKKGLDMDGLYRISGNTADVQKVRCQVDQAKYSFDSCDIHVLTGTLKRFFRELDDSLVPAAVQDKFLIAIAVKDRKQRLQAMRELIAHLPQPHHDTLFYLCKHLLNVTEQSAHNRMHLQNIALVFGPTILRMDPVNTANNGFSQNIILQNDIVEYILNNFHELFFK